MEKNFIETHFDGSMVPSFIFFGHFGDTMIS